MAQDKNTKNYPAPDRLNKLRDELADIAQVDQEPSLEGRQLLMVLSPIKKK